MGDTNLKPKSRVGDADCGRHSKWAKDGAERRTRAGTETRIKAGTETRSKDGESHQFKTQLTGRERGLRKAQNVGQEWDGNTE